MVSASQRLAHIDCLRAIAAGLVAFAHLFPMAFGPQQPAFARWIMVACDYVDLGVLGVFVFFLVSGYVVSYSILTPGSHNVVRFANSRFFRLYPAYWLSVCLGILYYGDKFPPLTYLVNFSMAQQFLGVGHVFGLYWTLTVELAFYVACVVLFVTGMLQRVSAVLALFVAFSGISAVSAIARYFYGVVIPFGWLMWFSIFFLGVILRHMDERGIRRNWVFWGGLFFYVVAAFVVSFGIWHDPQTYGQAWHQGFFSWIGGVFVFIIGSYFVVLRSRLLSYLGRISYSIYLFHLPVGGSIIRAIAGNAPSVPQSLAALVAGFAAVLAFSALAYRFVERPGMDLGKWLFKRLAYGRTAV